MPLASAASAVEPPAQQPAATAPLHSLVDLLFHILCFLRAQSLCRLLCSGRDNELRIRLLLPALADRRGWGCEEDSRADPLSTLHLSEVWDLLADVSSPVGVHYMLLRHTLFGTLLELQLSRGTTLTHFGFCVSDEAEPNWCRGSFVVRGPLQCRNWKDELRRCPRRTPIMQASLAQQSSYRVEHCGDRFVLRPANTGEVRPQLQLTKRGFIAIAAEGGGIVVEDGQPARRIEADAQDDEDAAC